MRKLILGVVLLISTVSIAQKSLFTNISTTDQYYRYFYVQDADGDGVYEIKDRDLIVKFNIKALATGEGYRLEAVTDEGNSKGSQVEKMDALEGYSTCVGYPYESYMRDSHSDDGLISIGDYVFLVSDMAEDGISFGSVNDVFIKKSASTETPEDGEKKKMSFKEKMLALKEASSGTLNYGPAHKELQSKNLDKLITDYLVAMKAKQDGRTAAEKQGDKNLENAKGKGAADLKAYNDSIKATPEYAKLKAHQARMKAMENGESNQTVTIYNKTGKDIYVYENGSRNSSTIRANSSSKLNCSSDYTYKFDPNSGGSGSTCYSANSRCGSSITVN